jgi:hypothetical protein
LIETLQDAATVPLDIPSIGTQPQITPRTTPPSDHRPVVASFASDRAQSIGHAGGRADASLRWIKAIVSTSTGPSDLSFG